MPRKKPRPRGGVRGDHASPGTGSVYQIQSGPRAGRWRGSAWVTLPDGEYKRIYVVATDEAAAREALERQRRQAERGANSDTATSPQTALRDYLVTWLDTVVRLETRPSTYETYTRLCARVAEQIGGIALEALGEADVQRCLAALSACRKPATIRLTHAVLHRALARAVEWRLIPANPADRATLPRVPRPEYRTFSFDQLDRLLAAAEADWTPLSAYWIVIGTTGLRRAEARGLRWRDVDLETGRLTVAGQLTRSGGAYRWSEPKTKSGRRSVELMARTVRALQRHRTATPGAADEYLFRQASGATWGDGSIQWHWQQLTRRAGLPGIRLHDLRHTVATLMMQRGQPAPVVAELLGHSDVRMTLSVYSHASPVMHRAAIRDLEGMLGPGFSPGDAPVDAPQRENRAS